MRLSIDLKQLQTPRLRFRPLTPEDHKWLLDFCHHDEATHFYFPGPDRVAFFNGWLERNAERIADNGTCMNVIEDTHSGLPVGQCGILVQNVDGKTELEVGYNLRPAFWGQGYATEAARSARDYVLKNKLAPRVISLIHPDNLASQRVAERNAMTRGALVQHRGHPAFVYSVNGKP